MIFAELPLDECEGALLAHSQRVGAEMFRKGRILGGADIDALRAAGLTQLTVAKLEPGDIGEDDAAHRLAASLIGKTGDLRLDPAFAGRVNIHAAAAGVVALAPTAIDALNAVDEAVTLATLPPFSAVTAGQMVATLKIIPYAVAGDVLDKALARIAAAPAPLLRLHPYRPQRVVLIQTELAGIKASVLDKTERVTAERLATMGQAEPATARCPHNQAALADALQRARDDGAEMVLVVGASAISDRRDVIPAAITALGGTIDHFGMPVDPGNLLLLAHMGKVPVLGLPGCARSARLNGCDWVMQRLLAGLSVGPADIRALGIGGLLAEIPSRPLPREARPQAQQPKVAAIVLAAGRSSRMGRNKLLLDWNGKPIVAHVLDKLAGIGFAETVVVIGHQAGKVKAALSDRPGLKIVEARDYASGMAASLKAGLKALAPGSDAALVILGDMPQISADLLKRLIAAYQPLEGRAIVLPVADGKRGNPVLFDRRFFAEMLLLEGDVGARHIIGGNAELVAEVPAPAQEIFIDVDTPEAYQQLLAGTTP
ncbi:molybdopterin-binding/glycosyltransferase family 2 protein [Dongia rigui]|uniref:Molybdopterin-binding/glycosyltransferase family 2 protein n=1 Tax=Dongia rigui TaxID=940149 RepID=A0ABU5DX70_9PROT|nr:molybdopterin-binding/glycosyltransferase family 2 protein [Dongia rigui]MDY0871171.1 molybdopterin-binding/glycosyltransferase family 2 protein [Dongia rigui]